jgi:hypothetical protein
VGVGSLNAGNDRWADDHQNEGETDQEVEHGSAPSGNACGRELSNEMNDSSFELKVEILW